MAKATLAARLILGLIFTVFGLNGFFSFLGQPELTPEGGALIGALVGSGYLLSVVKLVEVVAGLMLLSGFFVPLALLFLIPITLNIFLFHAILEPAGLPMGLVVLALNLFLGFVGYRGSFSGVLRARPDPE